MQPADETTEVELAGDSRGIATELEFRYKGAVDRDLVVLLARA